ncbi:hypothetical protein PsorP6_008464 [Peronosclerospora sorghi]|uniref:Uncharacterized protein n=1 Tax=Peronosclerospora sorghi TaxID=230839 RepID=A0ACC0WBP4_9STRA|nr:hypothetical protein PsorP6_008464 [Peronosclerospora sorghi]
MQPLVLEILVPSKYTCVIGVAFHIKEVFSFHTKGSSRIEVDIKCPRRLWVMLLTRVAPHLKLRLMIRSNSQPISAALSAQASGGGPPPFYLMQLPAANGLRKDFMTPTEIYRHTLNRPRQCKIRVVERLSEFHQAICTTSAECVVSGDKSDTFAGSNGGEKKIHLGIDHNPQGLPDVHSSLDSSLIHVRHQCLEPSCSTLPDGKLTPQLPSYESSTFLDDCTIEVLSDNELEQLSEKLLEVVVHQLVTVAHTSKELLEELNSLDETGLSLLHYVSFYNYFQLVPVLVAHGAHINQQSTQGQTALHLAAGCGHSEVVDVLQQSGADLQVRDFDGLTAADRADKSGHLDVAAHLYRLMADHRNCELAIDDNMYECGQVPMEIDDAWTPYIDAGDMGLLDLESDANELPWIRSPRSHSNSCGSEASVSSKVTSYVGENHKHNRKLLLGAFSTMSLRDKCALSLSISAGQRRDSSIGEELPLSPCTSSSTSTGFSSSPASIVGVDAKLIGGRFVLAGTENDSDVHSVIAEDEESLNKLQAAMELMGPEEKQSLEDEVKVLQHGVRAWLLRRNCKNMRETTKQLREATLSMKQEKSTEYSSNEQSERERAAVTVQAATRSMLARRSFLQTKHVAIKFQAATRGVLCRKKFARMKAQALSSLVIQRNVREWWNNQPDTSQDAHTDTFRPASVNCSTHN